MNPPNHSTTNDAPRKGGSPVIVPFVAPTRGPESFRSARVARGDVASGSGTRPAAPSAVATVQELGSKPGSQSVPQSDGGETPTPTDANTGSGAEALSDTIRRWARPTTLEELQDRGVRKVRSISMTRVGALLEKAVNRALIERTLGGSSDALSLSSTAREQFVRLSRAEATGTRPAEAAEEATPLRERATSTLDRLRRELEDRRRVLADREKQLSDGDLDQAEDGALSNQLRELFAAFAGVDDRRLEKDVLGLVLGELRTSRRRARVARLEEHQREIGTLERRITKLSALLGETEDALRRIQAGKSVDLGVSSIYDEVQGLGRDDDQYEQKAELMKSLFEANIALRR